MMRAETRPHGRGWLRGRGSSFGVLAAAVAAGILAGALAAQGQVEIAFVIAAGVFGLAALRYVSLVTWCLGLLITTIAMRGVVTVLGLPQAFDFVHYPVAAGFAISALQLPPRPASKGPAVWLAGLTTLCTISMLANLSHPLRMLIFLIIVGEPLLIIWTLCRFRIDQRERRSIAIIAVILAAVQVPIGVLQMTRFGLGDPVQGTLTGHGAGAHVLGALFALGLLITTAAMTARVMTIRTAVVAAGTSLGMMLISGSMAITVLTAVVVPFIPLLIGRVRKDSAGRVIATAGAAILFAAVALSIAQVLVSSIFERAERLIAREEFPELRMLDERSADPGLLVFGSGPGTSASRASILLIGAESQGSPLAYFGLDPTEEAIEIAASTRAAGGGTAESARSSALAIIGDLGLLGFLGLAVLFLRIWGRAARSSDWLAPGVRGALVLIAALIFVDSWIEYPEFAVPLAILIGLVLSGNPSDLSTTDRQGTLAMTSRRRLPTWQADARSETGRDRVSIRRGERR